MKTITYNPETHVLVPKGMMYELPELPMPIKGKFSKDLFDGVQMHQYAMRYLDEAIAAAPQPEPVDGEPVGYVAHGSTMPRNIRVFEGCSILSKEEADEYMPECVTALYTTPQPDRVTTKESYVELDIHSNPSRTEQQRKLDGSLEVGQLLGNGQNQETSHSKTVGDILLADAFRGDAANLIESIVALVSLDRAGVLVPHGIGGHARSLLESAAIRLSQPDRVAELEAETTKLKLDLLTSYGEAEELSGKVAELEDALKVAREGIYKFLVANNSTEFDCACDLSVGYLCGPCHADKQQQQLLESALAKINEVLKP